MATQGQSHPTTAHVQVEIDRKAKREGEKLMREQWENTQLYNNYATPLAGTFINLPKDPCLLVCPSCNIQDMSRVVEETHRTDWSSIILTRLFYCCFCCCCTKEEFCRPIFQLLPNHYCKHCGCYFGQSRYDPIHKLNIKK